MKYLFSLILIGSFAFSVTAQERVEIKLIVNGIGAGTPYATVIKKLGKPKSESKLSDEQAECGNGRSKILFYDGFEINLLGDENGKELSVLDMTITSSKWITDKGIKVSATPQQVMAKYGKVSYEDDYEEKEGGVKELTGLKLLEYSLVGGDAGGTAFYFKNNQLTKIELKINLC